MRAHAQVRTLQLMILGIIACGWIHAQRQPETAQVNIYLPLILDGGAKSDQFQTALTFVNTGTTAATVVLNTYGPDGSGWKLDLGAGVTVQLQFTIPSGGTRTFLSGIGPSLAVGWAVAFSTSPLQVVATVRRF